MIPRVLKIGMPVLGLSLSLGACSLTDPTVAAGYWHPRGVNQGNLAVMVADPHDLVEGRDSAYADGTLAANAVDRLYRDKVRALPDTNLSVGGSSTAATGGTPTDTTP